MNYKTETRVASPIPSVRVYQYEDHLEHKRLIAVFPADELDPTEAQKRAFIFIEALNKA